MTPAQCLPWRLAVFISVEEHGGDGACWIWQGKINRNGYGRVYWNGKEPVVHRVVFSLLVGKIPDGYLLDHVKEKCRRRDCCNPAHLEPVTPRDNTMRGQAVLFKPRISV
jgi:hypothetical protein